MQFPVFEHAYLLQALGWGIANSFWQIGSLWLLFQFITSIDKKSPALVKHYLSLGLLVISFIWFVFTIVQNYRLLSNATASAGIILNESWILRSQFLTKALPFISIAYLLLLCFYIIQYFKNLSVIRFLQTEGLSRAPVDFRLFTTQAALRLGIKKKIRVWLSEHVDVPSVTGFIKPVILLPVAIVSQLSMQQTEAILLHELAHIRRNDYLVNLLHALIELSLFFNPFAVLLSKTAKKERENCCDDWVMNFQYDRRDYAKALLVLEEQRHHIPFRFALAATTGQKKLLQRVKRLFSVDPQTDFSSFQKIRLIGLCFILLTGVFSALPIMIKKPSNNKDRDYKTREKLYVYKFEKLTLEKPSGKFFMSQPVKMAYQKNPAAASSKITKKRVKEPTAEYVNAFINEELINPVIKFEPIISQVVEKEINNLKYLVKIEEQQSGKKQINTYYFELNNKDGHPAIKPLIILNKIKEKNKIITGNLADSLETPARPCNKKKIRITS